jgi:branched-subunit amino acid permease
VNLGVGNPEMDWMEETQVAGRKERRTRKKMKKKQRFIFGYFFSSLLLTSIYLSLLFLGGDEDEEEGERRAKGVAIFDTATHHQLPCYFANTFCLSALPLEF